MSNFEFSGASEANMRGVNPIMIAIADRALQITKIDFGVPSDGGVRGASEQHRLFLDGKSPLDGYKRKSYHQSGNALDVFAYVDGKASWDMCHLSMVACAMLQAAAEFGRKLEWGGLWDNPDGPHFQLVR